MKSNKKNTKQNETGKKSGNGQATTGRSGNQPNNNAGKKSEATDDRGKLQKGGPNSRNANEDGFGEDE
jgi:hypothetical protein